MDPRPLTRAQLAASGHSDHDIKVAVERGSLLRIHHGVYVVAPEGVELGSQALEHFVHHARVLGMAPSLAPETVFSHESAAIMHGLPVLTPIPDRVQILRVRGAGTNNSSSGVQRHSVRALPDVRVVSGVRLTTPARTALDLARSQGFRAGLVAADAALRSHHVEKKELAACAEGLKGSHGAKAARAVAAAASREAESPGESLSRAVILESGLAAPILQSQLRGGDGILYRVDFLWPKYRVIGEFDGRVKYRDGNSTTLWQEKKREDELRRLGYAVVRWTWRDILDGTLIRRLRDAGVPPVPRLTLV